MEERYQKEDARHTVMCREYKLKIKGMVCASCIGIIENKLKGLDEVESAVVSMLFENAIVRAPLNSQITEEELKRQVELLGYEAELISVEEVDTNSNLKPKAEALLNLKVCQTTNFGIPVDLKYVVNSNLSRLSGITFWRMKKSNYLQIFYNPMEIGPREIALSLFLDETLDVSHCPDSASVFESENDSEIADSLRNRVALAALPSFYLFFAGHIIPPESMGFLDKIRIIGNLSLLHFISTILGFIVTYCLGYKIHQSAFYAMKRKVPDMNLLVSLATNVCFAYSFAMVIIVSFVVSEGAKIDPPMFFETSAGLITILLLGKFLEALVKKRAIRMLDKAFLVQGYPKSRLVVGYYLEQLLSSTLKRDDSKEKLASYANPPNSYRETGEFNRKLLLDLSFGGKDSRNLQHEAFLEIQPVKPVEILPLNSVKSPEHTACCPTNTPHPSEECENSANSEVEILSHFPRFLPSESSFFAKSGKKLPEEQDIQISSAFLGVRAGNAMKTNNLQYYFDSLPAAKYHCEADETGTLSSRFRIRTQKDDSLTPKKYSEESLNLPYSSTLENFKTPLLDAPSPIFKNRVFLQSSMRKFAEKILSVELDVCSPSKGDGVTLRSSSRESRQFDLEMMELSSQKKFLEEENGGFLLEEEGEIPFFLSKKRILLFKRIVAGGGSDEKVGFGGICHLSAEMLQVDDVLQVLAGEMIPSDGVKINSGVNYVDESMLTGESSPITKIMGTAVVGGSLCQSGVLLYKVTRVGSSSTIGQILKLLRNFKDSKISFQRIADKIAAVFIPFVLIASLITAVVWMKIVWTNEIPVHHPLLLMKKILEEEEVNEGKFLCFSSTHMPFNEVLEKIVFVMNFCVSVLAVACPCALGLATPFAIMVSSALAAKRGIIVKDGAAIESVLKMKHIIFDKTGSLTKGEFKVCSAAVIACNSTAFYELFKDLPVPHHPLRAHEKIPHMGKAESVIDTDISCCDDSDETQHLVGYEDEDSCLVERYPLGSDDQLLSSSRQEKREMCVFGYDDVSNFSRFDLCPATSEENRAKHLFWWLFASAESVSEHPIGIALKKFALSTFDIADLLSPEKYKNLPGKGIQCEIRGVHLKAGNFSFLQAKNSEDSQDECVVKCCREADDGIEVLATGRASKEDDKAKNLEALLENWVREMEQNGCTVVSLKANNLYLGAVALKDEIRPDAALVLHELKHAKNIRVWMCTGDNEAVAKRVAADVGIHPACVVANALPINKAQLVYRLKSQGNGGIGMIGDGINDCLALSAADLGISMRSGTDIAAKSAHVVLIKSRLSDIVVLFNLAKSTMKLIYLNLVWACAFNFISIPVAAGVLYPFNIFMTPLYAGILMAGSSLLVSASSFGLKLVNLDYFKTRRTGYLYRLH